MPKPEDFYGRKTKENKNTTSYYKSLKYQQDKDTNEFKIRSKPQKKKKGKSKRKEIIMQDDIIHIFTDGSAKGNPGQCGAACILKYNEHEKEIKKYLGHGTNNIAELMGIKIGLEAIKEGSRNIPVIVYSDSSYCLGVLGQNWNAKKNQKLIHEIKELMKKFSSIQLKKVKAHFGVEYNERVDKLAKHASGVIKLRKLNK